MRESWIFLVQSRNWSLSMRGNLRALAKEWDIVLLPVPGWPFMATMIGLVSGFWLSIWESSTAKVIRNHSFGLDQWISIAVFVHLPLLVR